MKRWILAAVACALTVTAGSAGADEGMWTFNHLPDKLMLQRYGFAPDQAWINHVRLSTLRLAGGCSGSFVSADGLVMTNHHCANECLSQLSRGGSNYMADGFTARNVDAEPKCPDVELNQLVSITDVTAQVNAATAGQSGAARIKAERAVTSKLQQACVAGDAKIWRCDTVSLYHGGRYAIYKYRRYQDVRLVFAPEQSIAFFGGDPDNFNFPRYDLDVTFFRAWVNGKPAHTSNYLKFSTQGAQDGAMTFVVGNPGSTQRETPWIELANMRDVGLIPAVNYLSELRGVLWAYSLGGKEQAQAAQDLLFGLDNSLKVYRGWLETLTNENFVARKKAADAALRDWMAATPARKAKFGDPWAELATAAQRGKVLHDRYTMLVGRLGLGLGTHLFGDAMTLVQAAGERAKPNAERLPRFRDANLPAVEQGLLANVPVYPKYEQTLMAWSLEKLRQVLGADDAFVHEVLGKQSPAELAAALVAGTHLADPAARKQLWEGGAKAIAASTDPMIVLARRIEPVAAKIRKQYEDEVQAPTTRANEEIAQARFAREGTSSYPDATFSPRLSFGKVVGWREGDHDVAPFTHFAGLYKRATGADPFKLPKSWLDAKATLDLSVPFDFVTNNDIIGGNSGSPVIDRKGEVVGLIFDGNIHSIGGTFGYDGSNNRAVAVDTAAIYTALREVYHLPQLAGELASGRR